MCNNIDQLCWLRNVSARTRIGDIVVGIAFLILSALLWSQSAGATDVKQVPFWDGEASELENGSPTLINRFGGPVVHMGQTGTTVAPVSDKVHTGRGAYRVDLSSTLGRNFAFFQLALSGFGPNSNYVMSRNLSRFDAMCFWASNESAIPLTLKLEVKDYRDSSLHAQYRRYTLPASSGWARYCASLADGWSIVGDTDLQQARFIGFVFENLPASFNGKVYLDDFVLVEPGPAMDSATAPLLDVIEQIAHRQFDGLWGSRSRLHGLIPLNSVFADIAALNSTSAVVWLLPEASRRGWVTKAEADHYIALVTKTLNGMMDSLGSVAFVPPRYVDWLTLQPSFSKEESPVDAAFMALALYHYKALPGTPASLRAQVEALLARFNFAAFGSPQGWKLAYVIDPPGFTTGSYDGYSGEIWAISLAAHLMPANSVDITTYYHTGINRAKTFLAVPELAHVVHSAREFRAPFLQWLFPLFVKLDGRTPDSYPLANLATNPLNNACLYQRDVNRSLEGKGRTLWHQKDAGDDVGGSHYEQYSEYWDGNPPRLDLLMPWSVSFSLLAQPQLAGNALRNHLAYGFHGPLGLGDSVEWRVGDPGPASISVRHDFWNLSLSTMAMLGFLSPQMDFLTSLPEVRNAVEKLGMKSCCAKDFNGDGKPDLVWQNDKTGQIGVWFMDGTSLKASSLFSPGQISLDWKIVGVGDFDGDGKPDLVWQNDKTGQIGVWFMDGTSLKASSLFSPGQISVEWKIVGIGDFDGDGKPDLVWENEQTGQIGVWFMDKTALKTSSLFSPGQVPIEWKIVGIGDFDGDGKPDLVWENEQTGQVGVWFMNGTALKTSSLFSPGQVPIEWKIMGVGAINSDCTADLIWQNTTTGAIGVWYMDLSSEFSVTMYSPAQVAPEWKIRNH